jgi:uncharacterized protein (DUF1697 family)
MDYAAFLLGINVGSRTVKMAELKALMAQLGYADVRTFLASGNVRFAAKESPSEKLERTLEAAYEKHFGFKIGVIVRSIAQLERMAKANPFKKVQLTKHTRRYVTFLGDAPKAPLKAGKVADGYVILKVTPGEIYSVLELSATVATPDVMKLLGVAYGKRITTRNWNTIEKILGVQA